jgi:hypothetical protein
VKHSCLYVILILRTQFSMVHARLYISCHGSDCLTTSSSAASMHTKKQTESVQDALYTLKQMQHSTRRGRAHQLMVISTCTSMLYATCCCKKLLTEGSAGRSSIPGSRRSTSGRSTPESAALRLHSGRCTICKAVATLAGMNVL